MRDTASSSTPGRSSARETDRAAARLEAAIAAKSGEVVKAVAGMVSARAA